MTSIQATHRVPAFAAALALAGATAFGPAFSTTAEAARVSHADAARFMAGLAPSEGSPLSQKARSGGWRSHAKSIDYAWGQLDRRQLAPIRAWSKQNLPGARKTMLYMFSGPDYLYANAFYPNARTYVFAGLEPIGVEPDLMAMSNGGIGNGLAHLRSSINTILRVSFFITKEMRRKLTGKGFAGILPVLYVFLARAGKDVDTVTYVKLQEDGALTSLPGPAGATGVRIGFSSGAGKQRQVLYYFRTDLSNGGLKRSGFTNFLKTLGPADSFLKSASYLMHNAGFSTIREHLLEQSGRIIQDDSGIPLRYFADDAWNITPHGTYTGPIKLFAGRYQRDMARLFRQQKAKPIRFGIGYRWRPRQSSLIVARKKRN